MFDLQYILKAQKPRNAFQKIPLLDAKTTGYGSTVDLLLESHFAACPTGIDCTKRHVVTCPLDPSYNPAYAKRHLGARSGQRAGRLVDKGLACRRQASDSQHEEERGQRRDTTRCEK